MTPEQKAAAVAQFRKEDGTPHGFAWVALKLGCSAASKGLQLNTAYTPSKLASAAQGRTGVKYPKTKAGCAQAAKDLEAVIKEARA